MRIEDYERNKREIELRSDRSKETVISVHGCMKKIYYDEGKVDIIGQLLQRMLNSLFIEGYLAGEVDVSVSFNEQHHGSPFEINIKVLK